MSLDIIFYVGYDGKLVSLLKLIESMRNWKVPRLKLVKYNGYCRGKQCSPEEAFQKILQRDLYTRFRIEVSFQEKLDGKYQLDYSISVWPRVLVGLGGYRASDFLVDKSLQRSIRELAVGIGKDLSQHYVLYTCDQGLLSNNIFNIILEGKANIDDILDMIKKEGNLFDIKFLKNDFNNLVYYETISKYKIIKDSMLNKLV